MKRVFLGGRGKSTAHLGGKQSNMIWGEKKMEKWAQLRSQGDFLEYFSVGLGFCPINNDWGVIKVF